MASDIIDDMSTQAGENMEPPMNFDDMPTPSMDKILELINSMKDISDEEKNELLRSVLGQGGDGTGLPFDDKSPLTHQFMILFCLLLVIICIFVFFGYKLYKSLKEREKRREEKKKQKQMKKKK